MFKNCLILLLASYVTGVIIETPLGKLDGVTGKSRNGKEYYSFLGIPYADKTKRFQVAKPVDSWNEVRQANQFGHSCPHFDPLTREIIGDEDCLLLNIYTPEKTGKKSDLPVMVWFHPGAFERGKSDDYDPMYFMDESVIIVTINFRLGSFGFLTTGDGLIPSNLGMKDQVLALQFIRKNIKSFGGDPNKITLFGCSAGGASVHYHMLSSMSKGLFRNGISQSGTSLAPWAFQRNPDAVTKKFGKFLSCPIDTSQRLKDCLEKKTARELVEAHLMFPTWAQLPFNRFAPSVDTGKEALRFLEDTPINLIKSGKVNHVPWMLGFVEDEGTVISTPIIMNETLLQELNDQYQRVLPIALNYDHVKDDIRDNVTTKILNHYFDIEEVSETTWEDLTKMFSDRHFTYPVDKAAKLHAKYGDVYLYEFAFPGEYSPLLHTASNTEYMGDFGIGHLDELPYQFKGFWEAPEYTDPVKHEAYEFSQKFIKLWTSFAKNSKPTATWEKDLQWHPLSVLLNKKQNATYYHIAGNTAMTDLGMADRMAFWEGLMETFQEDTTIPEVKTKDEL